MIINLHLLDACDFRCAHCFAHFGAKETLSCSNWKKIVDNILVSTKVERFNLAGGEPLLYKGIEELTDYIRSRGSAVSVISNGYSLSNTKISALKKCGISMIGLSIDSPKAPTLRKLGRHTVSGDILEPKRCIDICRRIREKGISLKINTVISQLNYTEDFSSFIRAINPGKWKLLKIKKFKSKIFDNTPHLINNAQFDGFIRRHKTIPHIAERTLANAYIMVDAFGNLVDTGSSNNSTVGNLLKENFKDVFARLNFDFGTYQARYAA